LRFKNNHYLETKKNIENIKIEYNGTKKKCAIFVMVQDEKIFLPIWLKYYSKYFGGEDIFVFDHRSSDDSINKCKLEYKFQSIRLNYPYSFDHKWFKFVAENMQLKLLRYYEYVLFTDVDEILFPNPELFIGLDDYINKLKKKSVKCKGYEIIHLKEKEKEFDPNLSVLAQRKYWHRNLWWDKTLLTKKPLRWDIGFHHISKFSKLFSKKDENLLLIHLHKLDFDMCWEKSLKRSELLWPEEDIKQNLGFQNRITDFEKFKEYYFNWPEDYIKIVEIPDYLRKTELF